MLQRCVLRPERAMCFRISVHGSHLDSPLKPPKPRSPCRLLLEFCAGSRNLTSVLSCTSSRGRWSPQAELSWTRGRRRGTPLAGEDISFGGVGDAVVGPRPGGALAHRPGLARDPPPRPLRSMPSRAHLLAAMGGGLHVSSSIGPSRHRIPRATPPHLVASSLHRLHPARSSTRMRARAKLGGIEHSAKGTCTVGPRCCCHGRGDDS